MANKKTIVWFEEVGKDEGGLVGGKGANLGEMTNARLPIPYGFIVTSAAYFNFIKSANLEGKISSILSTLNYNNPDELRQASIQIKELINNSHLPNDLVKEIIKYYDDLSIKENHFYNRQNNLLKKSFVKIKNLYTPPLVAVRSSATAEDLPGASFA